MDTKRTIIAVALSFAILFGWNFLADYMGWLPPPPSPQQQQPATTAPEGQAPQAVAQAPQSSLDLSAQAAFTPVAGQSVTVTTPLYKAVFYSGGGLLRSFELAHYTVGLKKDSGLVNLVDQKAAALNSLGLLINGTPTWNTGKWSVEGGDLNLAGGKSGTLRFVGELDGLRLVRELTFNADSYQIGEKVLLSSPAQRILNLGFTVGVGSMSGSTDNQYNLSRVAQLKGGSFAEETSEDTLKTGLSLQDDIAWGAVMSNYFLAAVSPDKPAANMRAKLENGVYRVALEEAGVTVTPGQDSVVSATYYFGPKKSDYLASAPNNLEKAINYGWFSIIARPLISMLNFFHDWVGNYGVAIILLTVVIKIVLWPLSYKSYKSMQQMKKLQPMMAKIREKYGSDRERMNKEMMQLYKTYKVNPAGGCLPIVLQIPVFIGLYQGLLNAIELRHAAFITHLPFTDMIWLADLSVKDPYYITPLIMGAGMFLQQKLTPTPGDPTQAKIMLFMPVIFTFMFINFPSGLVLYWLTNNVLSIGQQWWQLRQA